MGLNMPAKTVVFTSVRKWDGDSHRFIGSGEYIQVGEYSLCFLRIVDSDFLYLTPFSLWIDERESRAAWQR